MPHKHYKECIEAPQACAIMRNNCAAACLHEKDVTHLAKCIQPDMECAAICEAAAKVICVNGKMAVELCRLCRAICNLR